jgi:hypothetical protein
VSRATCAGRREATLGAMVTAAGDAQTLAGAVLSRRWRLAHKLGDGGMGEVYAADPIGGGGPRVAIKLLRPELASDPQVLSRFLEEGRTCLGLVHTNIVRVIECAAAEDGTPYLVMELLEGAPLGAYTRDGGRVPVAQAVAILNGILAGLAAAHARGIVHRDLKPDNVFLARGEGGGLVVKLLDFGIAKVMDAAGGMGSRTRTGMILGTPAYMSPEQISSARDVDQRTDLWSAGVLFYEMLTGRPPFPAATEYARLAAVRTAEPEAVERVDPSLAPFAAFVSRALRKNRDERFESALEMARALAACAGAAGIGGAADVAPVASAAPAEQIATVARTAGGTLASAAPSPGVVDRARPVRVVAPPTAGETLASNGLPLRRGATPGGVRPLVVVVLVLGALAAGFLLGWALRALVAIGAAPPLPPAICGDRRFAAICGRCGEA